MSYDLGKLVGKSEDKLKLGHLLTKKKLIIVLIVLLALCALLFVQAFVALRQKQQASEKPEFLFSIAGRANETLGTPLAVALSEERVYVADSSQGSIKVFGSDRRLLFDFPARIAPLEQNVASSRASYPVAIAVGKVGKEKRIFVSDLNSDKIAVFDIRGNPVGFLHDESLRKPLGLAYYKRRLYVTDIGDHTVKILTSGGKLTKKIGGRGSKEGKFSFPNALCVDTNGLIFVADSNNGRVQVFDSNGSYLRQLKGSGTRKLSLPRGVGIDEKNRVHVADALGHEVFVFRKTGNLLFTYGSDGSAEAQISLPNGIALDNVNRRVFVTDRGSSSVSVWKY